MYGQVSNSISILEKVKSQTEGYVNNTGKNLGKMEGTVEGLTDRMVDVDDNLNYMLGQLSLVVQEFNTVIRYRPRFFDQVGHQTTSASIGNKHFSLNHVIIRPTKIMNNLLKICAFKVIFRHQKSTESL